MMYNTPFKQLYVCRVYKTQNRAALKVQASRISAECTFCGFASEFVTDKVKLLLSHYTPRVASQKKHHKKV